MANSNYFLLPQQYARYLFLLMLFYNSLQEKIFLGMKVFQEETLAPSVMRQFQVLIFKGLLFLCFFYFQFFFQIITKKFI